MPKPRFEGDFKVSENQSLSDIAGNSNGIVLVFIPDTSGISSKLQLKDLRNNSYKITNLGWTIIIVTSEKPETSSDNLEELSLNFPIVHDHDNEIAKYYDTLGRTFDNPYISKRTKRRTYILNNELDIMHVIDDIHPGYHTEDILILLTPHQAVESSTNQLKV